jgi:hypothetical protein
MPSRGFIEMLNSGVWEDRNKPGLLVMVLTGPQPSQLLKRLRAEALQSLIEMARWRNACHAYAYSTILGRIAGFDEARIEQLIQSGKAGKWRGSLPRLRTSIDVGPFSAICVAGEGCDS